MPSSSIILSLAAVLPAVLANPYGNYSQPINYSEPSYKNSVSVPVYDAPKSTPCASSSVKKPSSTPVYNDYGSYAASTPKNEYDSYPASTPKNEYDSYPASTPKNEYGSYPASTPVNNYGQYPPASTPKNEYGSYPVTSSKPSYGDNYKTPSSKTTITTTYTTTYVDVCETGYITKTTTFAVTYCPPTATPNPGSPKKTPTNYGWDYETKVCNKGCGEGPKTVTVTVPCKNCNYAKPTPTPPAQSKPVCNGYDCKVVCDGKDCIYSTTKVYSTKIITVTKTPIYDTPKSTPVYSKPDTPISKQVVSSKPFTPVIYTPPVSKPNVPASSPVISKPSVPTGVVPPPPSKNNNTMSIGTGVKPTPSKTGYVPPAQFTGAAAGVQAGGFVAAVAVAAAMFL